MSSKGRFDKSNLILINGSPLPPPARGMEIVTSITVDAGRNASNEVVGQQIGRKLWKINNLQWNGLSADAWAYIKGLLAPFFVKVTFTGDDKKRHTVTMYTGDATGTPYSISGTSYEMYESCKVNLIDCGKTTSSGGEA